MEKLCCWIFLALYECVIVGEEDYDVRVFLILSEVKTINVIFVLIELVWLENILLVGISITISPQCCIVTKISREFA